MHADVEREHNHERDSERKYFRQPSMKPASIGIALGARIFPDIPCRDREPDEERPNWLPRRQPDRAEHPTNAAGKERDDGPDWQKRGKEVRDTTNERCFYHFGHAMVTYAFIS